MNVGGELMVTNDPRPGQIVRGQSEYGVNCADGTPKANYNHNHWTQSTIDTVDRYGTATHPVVNSGLYESDWSGVFNYTAAQYVGVTDYISITLARNADGSLAADSNGNYSGFGFHYRTTRTDRQTPTVPGAAAPLGWTNTVPTAQDIADGKKDVMKRERHD